MRREPFVIVVLHKALFYYNFEFFENFIILKNLENFEILWNFWKIWNYMKVLEIYEIFFNFFLKILHFLFLFYNFEILWNFLTYWLAKSNLCAIKKHIALSCHVISFIDFARECNMLFYYIRLYFTVFLLARSNTRDIPFSNILISKKQFLCNK